MSEITLIILAALTVIIGSIDELKYILQYRKIMKTRKFSAISKRFYLTSVITKSWVLFYAILRQSWVFALLYVIGLINSATVLSIIYRYSNIKNRNIFKFLLRCFHINVTITKR